MKNLQKLIQLHEYREFVYSVAMERFSQAVDKAIINKVING